MHKRNAGFAAIAGVLAVTAAGYAQSEFTYQGRLRDAGVPGNAEYDLVFRLFNAGDGGSQIGSALQFNDWPVSEGLFTVPLDFGANVFDGDPRWLQVEVRPGNSGGAYEILAPRQPLTAVPYAMYAFGGPGGPGFWAANGNHIYKTNSGNVGIGTNNPSSARLHVVGGSGQWGLRVTGESPNPAIYATLNGNGGTSAVYGTTSSTGAGARGVQGLISGSTPGDGAAGVAGIISSGSSSEGYGVYGKHSGSGYGVYGESLSTSLGVGTYGRGRYGVFGAANNDVEGIGGVFAGGGDFGSGLSLWAVGHALMGGLRVGSSGLFDAPTVKFQVENGTDASPAGGGFLVVGSTGSANVAMDNNEIMAINNGAPSTLYINNEGGDVRIGQNGGSTTVFVPVLAITGADVAEKFPISDSAASAEPGTVMEIDPDNAGELRVSRNAYNRRVAGVVSGAGDLPVGAILGNLPGHEDAPPIALSGRVWVRCDASGNAISPGDLLTTSDLPGHAMKAADSSRAHGAVIGKAMTALAQGETGLVLVLVNLQ